LTSEVHARRGRPGVATDRHKYAVVGTGHRARLYVDALTGLFMATCQLVAPEFGALRRLVQEGRIGKVHLVEVAEILDASHGADYFRRWHRERRFSGALLVHKACHHFDLVNWWLASLPKTVYAVGSLSFYGLP
jgi:Oxidoreductase family, C-terminal alpha/beta domain